MCSDVRMLSLHPVVESLRKDESLPTIGLALELEVPSRRNSRHAQLFCFD